VGNGECLISSTMRINFDVVDDFDEILKAPKPNKKILIQRHLNFEVRFQVEKKMLLTSLSISIKTRFIQASLGAALENAYCRCVVMLRQTVLHQ
jgi:hypothetical protein